MKLRFGVGDRVIERVGSTEDAPEWETLIVSVEGEHALTETGRWYDRLTGGRAPVNSTPYRSIRSAGRRREGAGAATDRGVAA